MTPKQIDRAVRLFTHREKVSRIASKLGVELDEVERALVSRGLILKRQPPVELHLKGLPRWCFDRLTNAAKNWGYDNAGEVAALILISRLAKGSIGQDLRGVGVHRPENLGNEKTVRELIS